ncbi:unnamed protein product [Trichobilharzia regenti]|nr:unnamed protein product [Trichobilharzia regenti]
MFDACRDQIIYYPPEEIFYLITSVCIQSSEEKGMLKSFTSGLRVLGLGKLAHVQHHARLTSLSYVTYRGQRSFHYTLLEESKLKLSSQVRSLFVSLSLYISGRFCMLLEVCDRRLFLPGCPHRGS